MYDIQNKRIWVAGHNGMVGRAVIRQLLSRNCETLTANRDELDLTRQSAVASWVKKNRPDAVIICAAKVGGILANNRYPADFLYENLMIESNIINASFRYDVEKLLFLGSSCIYPRNADQPMKESALLTGALERTNEAYAIAKIAGIKLCESYRRQHGVDFNSAMPTNLYGPFDNFNLEQSHVIPALLRKAHEAKLAKASTLEIWGTGKARREFIHVDDCAAAVVYLLQYYSDLEHVNVGSGVDISIRALSEIIKEITGFDGALSFDRSKPDGTPVKLLDTKKINALGWKPEIALADGLMSTYQWYTKSQSSKNADA